MNTIVKAQVQLQALGTFGAGLIGFTGVVGLGGILILYQGLGGASKVPLSAYAPVEGVSSLAAPAPSVSSRAHADRDGAPVGEAAEDVSSPAPLLSPDVRDENAASASADALAAGAVARSAEQAAGKKKAFRTPRLVVTRHLDIESSASSSASMPISADYSAPRTADSAEGGKTAAKPDSAMNRGTVASIVHYGVTSRAELMGRAAGPVYNFSGAER